MHCGIESEFSVPRLSLIPFCFEKYMLVRHNFLTDRNFDVVCNDIYFTMKYLIQIVLNFKVHPYYLGVN